MELTFEQTVTKAEVFKSVESYLSANKLKVINKDDTRPWGGFLVIDESQSSEFAALFFSDVKLSPDQLVHRRSPKILIVQPHARLSWQYHHRRTEMWRVIGGEAGLVRSKTNQQTRLEAIPPKTTVSLKSEERHRLVGLTRWGIVAEIWEHTDPAHPSDESDIVRLEDDFGRS